MSELDDPILTQLLGDVAGPEPDAELAYGAVLGRVRRARRRRTAMWVSGTGTACALAVVALTVSGGQRSPDRIVPADPIEVTSTVPDGTTPGPTIPDEPVASSTSAPPTVIIVPVPSTVSGGSSTPTGTTVAPPPTTPPPASTSSTPSAPTTDDDDAETSSTVDDDDSSGRGRGRGGDDD